MFRAASELRRAIARLWISGHSGRAKLPEVGDFNLVPLPLSLNFGDLRSTWQLIDQLPQCHRSWKQSKVISLLLKTHFFIPALRNCSSKCELVSFLQIKYVEFFSMHYCTEGISILLLISVHHSEYEEQGEQQVFVTCSRTECLGNLRLKTLSMERISLC